MSFLNRIDELTALEEWWERPDDGLGLVWGRRRVGKTWLVREFAQGRPHLFHTGADRSLAQELTHLAADVAKTQTDGAIVSTRDLAHQPFTSWDDALEELARTTNQPLLLVLDEYPELLRSEPALPGILRAWWDRWQGRTALRVLLCGSAVRTMEQQREHRAPLFGRFGVVLLVHPFRPHEAGTMLASLTPPDRARVWALVGGTPTYLAWWDQAAPFEDNLKRLFLQPGARLSEEARLILATEVDGGQFAGPVLRAIAQGRTKFHEIKDAVGVDPNRVLDRLVELRLVERMVPVTDDPDKTRRKAYAITDNLLAFLLGPFDRYRGEIERGAGDAVLPVIMAGLDDTIGPRWEDAMRWHLRRVVKEAAGGGGVLGIGAHTVGPWWRDGEGGGEIDAVVLGGRDRRPMAVAEAKWAGTVDARRIEAELRRKATLLGGDADLRLVIAARDKVVGASRATIRFTAADIFSAG